MAGHEDYGLKQHEQPPESNSPRQKVGGLFSWWLVWIPVIAIVTLWLGGWGFGDYGGPWGPKPQNTQPQISDQGVAIFNSNHRVIDRACLTKSQPSL